MTKRVYLDYGAATPLRKEVFEEMQPFLMEVYANPSALYGEADRAQKALKSARERVAHVLQVRPVNVIFTSGSTESNNLAILGRARAVTQKGHMVSTQIEHSSIRAPLEHLKKNGWDISLLSVDNEGSVKPDAVGNAVTERTALVTLAWANADIGTVQPVEEIAKEIKRTNTSSLFHIDASQAGTTLSLSAACKAGDLVTVSPAKMYGPHGSGLLIQKDALSLEPLLFGGRQERHLRPGTEYVAGAVGAASSLERAQKEQKNEAKRLKKLQDMLIENISGLDDVVLTGSRNARLAHHVSFAVKDMDGEEIAVRLDARGFAVGTGSACTTGDQEVSEAVKALGVPVAYHSGTIRVTLGRLTEENEISLFVAALKDTLREMRSFI